MPTDKAALNLLQNLRHNQDFSKLGNKLANAEPSKNRKQALLAMLDAVNADLIAENND